MADDLGRYCANCGQEARYGIEDRCRACNDPFAAAAPNVQLANLAAQIEKLNDRFESARAIAAHPAGVEQLLDIGACTKAVINVSVSAAVSLFIAKAPLYSPYEVLVDARARSAASFTFDRERRATDALLYGQYGKNMVYAALSADGRGLTSYGPIHIELLENTIRYRATVLEENSYDFMNHHALTPGTPLPGGYLARWHERGKLAVTKLAKHLTENMGEASYQALFLYSDGNRETDSFMEVHIYGDFNWQAIHRLWAPKRLADDNDNLMLLVLRNLTQDRSIEVFEL
jgi:hypothetical protein